MLEAAAVAPDTSSVAEGDLDSSSEETSGFAGALSSASGVVKYTINTKQLLKTELQQPQTSFLSFFSLKGIFL